MKGERVMQIRGLNKSFGDNHVLRDFEMDLYEGENVVVLGKSGSGKSVLIKCIIGLLRPDAGSIHVLGQDVLEMNHEQLDRLRVRVGFLFQSNALYDSMTVRENLEFPLRRHWLKEQQNREDVAQRVMEVLANVGLEHTVDMMPAELSGGMRKRIALARMLILRPQIMLYDEPTTGLDPVTSREISELILALQKEYNAASVIISHDMSCIEITSNRVIMLIDGRAYVNDTYHRLQASDDPKIATFFEAKNHAYETN